LPRKQDDLPPFRYVAQQVTFHALNMN
jgi:hypothetical protein